MISQYARSVKLKLLIIIEKIQKIAHGMGTSSRIL